jgi:hypothetical protein
VAVIAAILAVVFLRHVGVIGQQGHGDGLGEDENEEETKETKKNNVVTTVEEAGVLAVRDAE